MSFSRMIWYVYLVDVKPMVPTSTNLGYDCPRLNTTRQIMGCWNDRGNGSRTYFPTIAVRCHHDGRRLQYDWPWQHYDSGPDLSRPSTIDYDCTRTMHNWKESSTIHRNLKYIFKNPYYYYCPSSSTIKINRSPATTVSNMFKIILTIPIYCPWLFTTLHDRPRLPYEFISRLSTNSLIMTSRTCITAPAHECGD